jgi:hypothetical protein
MFWDVLADVTKMDEQYGLRGEPNAGEHSLFAFGFIS